MAFGALALALAWLLIPRLPASMTTDYLLLSLGVVGAYIGWRMMGFQVGNDLLTAARRGLTTSATVLIWAVLLTSLRQMLRNSTRFVFDDATEALLSVIENFFVVFRLAMTPEILVLLLAGGIVGGCLAELAHRMWR